VRPAPGALLLVAMSVSFVAAGADAPAADGKQLFERRCGVCHLQGQTGTTILARRLGPERALLAERTDLTAEYIRLVVRAGLVNMPPLTRVELPDAELEAISAWLRRPRP
jgi:mono/diheme cytochrome c family protein